MKTNKGWRERREERHTNTTTTSVVLFLQLHSQSAETGRGTRGMKGQRWGRKSMGGREQNVIFGFVKSHLLNSRGRLLVVVVGGLRIFSAKLRRRNRIASCRTLSRFNVVV